MLDVKIGTKGQNYVTAAGEMLDLAAELLYIVQAVHSAMAKSDVKAAVLFRAAIQKGVTFPDVWEDDVPGVMIAGRVRRGE